MANNFNNFPPPPFQFGGAQGYNTDGKFNQPIIVASQNGNQVTPVNNSSSNGMLGANFSGLIGSNVTVPAVSFMDEVVTETTTKKRKRAKKNDKGEVEVNSKDDSKNNTPVNSRDIVENTIYSESYNATTRMAYDIIGQADEILSDTKQELDLLRASRNVKGKYKYITDMAQAMSSLMQTKMAAIREINSTIKNANDAEYRRFKDMRAFDSADDNKMVMDAYNAFISAPIGQYQLPTTAAITSGLDGVVFADNKVQMQNMDAGMAQYLSNLTPEENLMLVDSNKDIEEVLVYDQATGAKSFKWMNTRTNEILHNMPPSSNLVVEDFVIDPRTKLAKNINLNSIKKVITLNEGDFDKF